jgi:hypothetical protein
MSYVSIPACGTVFLREGKTSSGMQKMHTFADGENIAAGLESDDMPSLYYPSVIAHFGKAIYHDCDIFPRVRADDFDTFPRCFIPICDTFPSFFIGEE